MASTPKKVTRTLPAGGTVRIAGARGSFVFVAEGTQVSLTARQTEVGGKSGSEMSLSVVKGDKVTVPFPFDEIELTSLSTGEQQVELYFGDGDFAREISASNPVKRADSNFALVDVQLSINANNARRAIAFLAPVSNPMGIGAGSFGDVGAVSVWIAGDSALNPEISTPWMLWPGDYLYLETNSALRALWQDNLQSGPAPSPVINYGEIF